MRPKDVAADRLHPVADVARPCTRYLRCGSLRLCFSVCIRVYSRARPMRTRFVQMVESLMDQPLPKRNTVDRSRSASEAPRWRPGQRGRGLLQQLRPRRFADRLRVPREHGCRVADLALACAHSVEEDAATQSAEMSIFGKREVSLGPPRLMLETVPFVLQKTRRESATERSLFSAGGRARSFIE